MKDDKLVWKIWLRDHYKTQPKDFHVAHNLTELRYIIDAEEERFPVVESCLLCAENNYSLFT
jgi:hypothetical protein